MTFRVAAYPLAWRIARAALIAISRASPLVLFGLLWFSADPPSNPLKLIRWLSAYCLAPGAAAFAIKQMFAAELLVETDAVVVTQRRRRAEIPLTAISTIEPWAIPLPSGGLWLRLRSGRRFDRGLELDRPLVFLDGVAAAGARTTADAVKNRPAVLYADARGQGGPWRWYHVLLKFPVFALVPTVPLFRLHQHIAYGGTFGEYYTYGLKAYLLGFGVYWGALTVYVVMWAALWRAVAEAIAFPAAQGAPAQAARVRRAVEIVHRILYYGGVPAILILRFWENILEIVRSYS